MTVGKADSPLCLDGEYKLIAETIIEIHDGILEKYKGFNPVLTEKEEEEQFSKLLSVVLTSFCTCMGCSPSERFADIFEQLANFACHLASDHIFPDANKRTTVKITLALMYRSGYKLIVEDSPDPSANEMYQWIEDLVQHKMDELELASALKSFCE